MLSKIKKVTILDFYDLFKVIITFLPGRLFKRFNQKEIMLVSERENDARDNGYHFYKYVRKEFPEYRAYYPINYQSTDYNKVKDLGNIIKFGGLKHHFLFWACDRHVSAHIGNGFPSHRICFNFLMWGFYDFKNVFIQHGIVNKNLPFLYKENNRLDMLTTTCHFETDYHIKEFGYNKNDVKEVGMARYDSLFDESNEVNKKNILVMPTWRLWLIKHPNDKLEKANERFLESNFFKTYNSLLNNQKLLDVLDKNNIGLTFILHNDLSLFSKNFSSTSNNIQIYSQNEIELQSLIKKSNMFITDYSSVFFDFAYLNKPVLFYKFDSEQYYSDHYLEGSLDGADDSKFGYIINDEAEMIKKIESYIDTNMVVEKEHLDFYDYFFSFRDHENCKRIFEEVMKI